jgi:hypothetical protein
MKKYPKLDQFFDLMGDTAAKLERLRMPKNVVELGKYQIYLN